MRRAILPTRGTRLPHVVNNRGAGLQLAYQAHSPIRFRGTPVSPLPATGAQTCRSIDLKALQRCGFIANLAVGSNIQRMLAPLR